jgi:hypothetical protein
MRRSIYETIEDGRIETFLAQNRHLLNDSLLGDFWRDLVQFAVNTRSEESRVVGHHPDSGRSR